MGFTLRAALAVLGDKCADRRGRTRAGRGRLGERPDGGDFWRQSRRSAREHPGNRRHRLIRSHRRTFDAILLDVDNGPEGLTRKANDALYNSAGLKAAHAALRPGGVLAVWSSGPNPAFTKRLRGAGFDVNEVDVRATGKGGGARHVIWIAMKA